MSGADDEAARLHPLAEANWRHACGSQMARADRAEAERDEARRERDNFARQVMSLRDQVQWLCGQNTLHISADDKSSKRAAAAESRVKELEGVLEPFATFAASLSQLSDDVSVKHMIRKLTPQQFFAAAAALSRFKDGTRSTS